MTENVPEREFAKLAKNRGCDVSKCGYPDFAIIVKGEIVGFVEVKPNKNHKLKRSQSLFAKFCIKRGIPFARWEPGSPMPWFIEKFGHPVWKKL